MDRVTAAAMARATNMSLRCGPAGATGRRGSERPRAPRTGWPRFYWEWTDSSVLRTGLGAYMCQLQGHVPGTIGALTNCCFCFAAYEIRSIDELLGHTTGLLGYIRPASSNTAQAIGGTAGLALRYSIISWAASSTGSSQYQ
jgi:hypothetical protein